MKLSLYALFMIGLSFFSCSSQGNGSSSSETNTTSSTDIKEVTIDFENFDTSKTNLTSWLFVFGISPDGQGVIDRVQKYSSKQEIYQETLKNLQKMKQIDKGQDYIAETISQRASQVVDFSKQDLVIVTLSSGGPPFGEFSYKVKGNEITFCMKQPPTLVSGMALKSVQKCYAVSKNYSVKLCK